MKILVRLADTFEVRTKPCQRPCQRPFSS